MFLEKESNPHVYNVSFSLQPKFACKVNQIGLLQHLTPSQNYTLIDLPHIIFLLLF